MCQIVEAISFAIPLGLSVQSDPGKSRAHATPLQTRANVGWHLVADGCLPSGSVGQASPEVWTNPWSHVTALELGSADFGALLG